MSSEKCRFAVKQIDLWTRAAMLVLMLAAAPHVSAQASREPDDGSEDDRQLRTTSGQEARPGNPAATTLSIPLSGTGVQAHARPSRPKGMPSASAKPPVKKGATTGSSKDAGKKDSGAAHVPRSHVKDKGEYEFR
jgi:hypothetical protein